MFQLLLLLFPFRLVLSYIFKANFQVSQNLNIMISLSKVKAVSNLPEILKNSSYLDLHHIVRQNLCTGSVQMRKKDLYFRFNSK